MKSKKQDINKKTIGKILRYIRHYIPLLVISLILAAAIVVGTLYIPVLIGRAVDLFLYGKGGVDFDELYRILISPVSITSS